MGGALARMLHHVCIGDIESVRVIDEEVSVHVEARCNSGSGGLRPPETVPSVCGDAACVYDPDRIEHGASVLVQDHFVADRIADHLQADTLGFESGGIGTVVVTLNSRRI